MQSGALAARHAAAAVAVHQRRKMLAFKSRSGGIHDHDALDHIAQLADVPRPGVAHQGIDGIVGDLSWTPAIGRGKFLQKVSRTQRESRSAGKKDPRGSSPWRFLPPGLCWWKQSREHPP